MTRLLSKLRTAAAFSYKKSIGHPIVGDGKYGGSGQENLGDGWGAQLGGDISKKLHLHARSLVIEHPVRSVKTANNVKKTVFFMIQY